MAARSRAGLCARFPRTRGPLRGGSLQLSCGAGALAVGQGGWSPRLRPGSPRSFPVLPSLPFSGLPRPGTLASPDAFRVVTAPRRLLVPDRYPPGRVTRSPVWPPASAGRTLHSLAPDLLVPGHVPSGGRRPCPALPLPLPLPRAYRSASRAPPHTVAPPLLVRGAAGPAPARATRAGASPGPGPARATGAAASGAPTRSTRAAASPGPGSDPRDPRRCRSREGRRSRRREGFGNIF
jgi:hypothetical protein